MAKTIKCQVESCDEKAYAWQDQPDDDKALCEKHYGEYQTGKRKPAGWPKVG